MAHPDYQQGKADCDLAVVVMDRVVRFGNGVSPICLWEEGDVLNEIVGAKGTVVGWGKDESGTDYVPDAKQVDLPVVSQESCIRSHPAFFGLVSNRTFCAGELSLDLEINPRNTT